MSLRELWMEDGGWRGPARDLGAATSQMHFPLRNSELLYMHMRHRVLARRLAHPAYSVCARGALPMPRERAQGVQARGMRGAGSPAWSWCG